MSYDHGTVVHHFRLSNPIRRIDVVARNDGTFQSFEQLAIENDPTKGWTPYRVSGVYLDAGEAELSAREMWTLFDFGGMTVNERLFCMGTIEEFDSAGKNRDRIKLATLLAQVGLADQANQIVEKIVSSDN